VFLCKTKNKYQHRQTETSYLMVEIWPFIAISIPTMVFLGMRHALDVDHITAIDNLVRLHNAIKKSRWVGTGFSAGHMISVLAEMVFITCNWKHN
ncbi:MAG: hypothetical protein KGH85_08625, partial [Thaumarchaeota archaeon]|nr:hypothetical protein [Nitrososphaerota archaeon]